jgi:ribosomal protein L11 methyltransferase
MKHVKITFAISSAEQSDMLIAMLSEAGYEGFEETGDTLLAYIIEPLFDAAQLKEIADTVQVSFQQEIVEAQNWNAVWESNFQPVVVDDFCTVRAHFHDIKPTTLYDIVITPKMSFGTGHHATTRLMMMLMRQIPFGGKTVLDFGTGTGILAILASFLGAKHIEAIDNDEWSVENAQENIERNNCKNISTSLGSLENIGPVKYDIILANINRHILLHYMGALFGRLQQGGTILMSGLLTDDEQIIRDAATAVGFRYGETRELSNWIAIIFTKG